MVINVEAKADEPCGNMIGEYYDQKTGSGSNIPFRIQQLSQALFGREPDEAIRKLRYQLLHATAATLIEAKESGAELGLFLVHQFRSESLNENKLTQNAADWENFVHAFPELATARIEANQILGPISVPGEGVCRMMCHFISGNWLQSYRSPPLLGFCQREYGRHSALRNRVHRCLAHQQMNSQPPQTHFTKRMIPMRPHPIAVKPNTTAMM
jgi:hypothetical protein